MKFPKVIEAEEMDTLEKEWQLAGLEVSRYECGEEAAHVFPGYVGRKSLVVYESSSNLLRAPGARALYILNKQGYWIDISGNYSSAWDNACDYADEYEVP
jgi:hypothetical protein